MSCAACETLREENRQLRRELGLFAEARRVAALTRAFGLSPIGARIVLALHRAAGRSVSRTFLEDHFTGLEASGREIDDPSAAIKVQVSRIRHAIGPGAILTVWGVGYRLSAEGLAKVEAALSEAA